MDISVNKAVKADFTKDMYYRVYDWIGSLIIIIAGMIVCAIILSYIWRVIFRRDFFSGGELSMYAKGFLVIVLGGIIAYCLDESYRLFNSEHRAFSEKSIYFDPYGPHYWPPSNEFYDAQGNKITYEEGLKAYNELHDFVFDKEGNVLEIYEKGKGPKSAAGQSRSLDSPYYIFNMTEDEKSAYYSAVGYIEGKSISKNELLQILSESYSTDIAKFAVKAAEENEKVDWIEECRQATDLVMKWDVSREEAMDALTGEFGRGFTVEEAEMVLNEYSF